MAGRRMKRDGVCSVVENEEVCGKEIIAKGFCSKHYWRHKKNGDPLIVKSQGTVKRTTLRDLWFICEVCGDSFKRHAGPGRPPTICSEDCKVERSRRQARDWYKQNPEQAKAYRASEKAKQSFQEYYENNREREIQRALKYARDHPEKKQAYDAKRYALTRGAPDAELFSLNEIYERDKHVCYLCDRLVERDQATMDHVMPVSRGGLHTRANVKLAHWSCNSSKSDRILEGSPSLDST